MTAHTFDDRAIRWHTLPTVEHLHYTILDIDYPRRIVDVLFKFAANKQVVLHRHVVQNNMLVIQGEHRIYDADGRLQDVRPTGRYTSSPPQPEPHREGGGEQDAIVLFSIRGAGPVFYEILAPDGEVVGTLGWQEFMDLHTAQGP